MATRTHGLYRRLDHPAADAAHGACYLSGDAGPCVDTGVSIYMEGSLTLSVNAIRELAEVAGFSVDAEAVEHEHQLAEQEHLIAQLREQNADLLEQVEAVGLAVARARKAR